VYCTARAIESKGVLSFPDIIKSGERILSFEFFPPKKREALGQTRDLIRELSRFNPHFMTCTYGAGGGTRETTIEIVDFIRNELSIPAVAHLTCVGHTTEDLDQILAKLQSTGLRNILALRGDPPKGETKFTPVAGGLSSARELVGYIHEKFDFNVAVAGYPEVHPEAASPQADLDYLKSKVDAGADLIITQLFFDADVYFSFQDKCRRAGIEVPILPGIMPISSIKQVRKFTGMCGATIPEGLQKSLEELEKEGDQVSEFGTEFATELVQKLFDGGAPGVHLYTLNKSSQVGKIAEAVGFSLAD